MPSNNNYNMKGISPIGRTDASSDAEIRDFNRGQKGLAFENKNNVGGSSSQFGDNQLLMNHIVQILKDKHLPGMLNIVKAQISSDIVSIKSELHFLKEQFERQEAANNELRSQTNGSLNFNSQFSNGKDKLKSGEISELQTNYFLLQGKINDIETKLHDKF